MIKLGLLILIGCGAYGLFHMYAPPSWHGSFLVAGVSFPVWGLVMGIALFVGYKAIK